MKSKIGRPNGSKYNIEDYIGKRINRWTIKSFAHKNKNGEDYWNTVCDCGTTSKIRVYPLIKGLSQGCRFCRPQSTPSKPMEGWTEDMVFHFYYFRVIRSGALIRNLEFSITPSYINDLFIKQEGKCALSGLDLYFGKKYKDTSGTASLDRIDSTKGYIEGNLQWIHKDLNRLKLNFQNDKFIELCKLVAQNIKI